jgi:hypothetical protein
MMVAMKILQWFLLTASIFFYDLNWYNFLSFILHSIL